ncbi:UDP-2,3-diacylglucosamine diphosphatase [Porphyromonas pogonae]|uniref:UDP-2,3-diacylglucosamine diphosphatase n=1 Tax=Porphyromonas pogonae TaxID=867595 RepID=UPI002E76261A|nr:UDP-2,3-diacylglucosamine diphosphatase [Porphyromonas pogonae]
MEPTLTPPARTKIFFTSDAHLGSYYHQDALAVERKLTAWLDSIKYEAIALYLLGDMFDYWFEYKTVVPRGHVRFLGKLAELSDMGVEIHFFAGNHDIWFTDYLGQEIGATIHHRPIITDLLGKRFRLSHGDSEYCPLKKSYNFLYHAFRSPLLIKLYGAIHPRWTVGFAMNWSLRSRKKGLKQETEGKIPHAYRNEYFNVEDEWLVKFSKEYSLQHPDIDFFIYGHRHIMMDLAIKNDKRVVILGDWLSYFSFGVWDGSAFYLEVWDPQEQA